MVWQGSLSELLLIKAVILFYLTLIYILIWSKCASSCEDNSLVIGTSAGDTWNYKLEEKSAFPWVSWVLSVCN